MFVELNLSQEESQSGKDVSIDKKTKVAVIEEINKLLIDEYIFLEMAEKMQNHLNTKLEKGEYNMRSILYLRGMNNHMGSWITLNREAISKLLVSIRKHRLLLIDSRTSEDSIVCEIARKMEILAAARTIFLDQVAEVSHSKKTALEVRGAGAVKRLCYRYRTHIPLHHRSPEKNSTPLTEERSENGICLRGCPMKQFLCR